MKTWYIIGAIVIIALAVWYFYGINPQTAPAPTAPTATTQTATSAPAQTSPSSGNTTADIANDLDQTPDTSAGLNQAAADSAQAVQGL